MPRALSERWSTVGEQERPAFLARARERRLVVESLGAHYWVFERDDSPGRVVEFVEAPDATVLARARALAGHTNDAEEILLDQLEF